MAQLFEGTVEGCVLCLGSLAGGRARSLITHIPELTGLAALWTRGWGFWECIVQLSFWRRALSSGQQRSILVMLCATERGVLLRDIVALKDWHSKIFNFASSPANVLKRRTSSLCPIRYNLKLEYRTKVRQSYGDLNFGQSESGFCQILARTKPMRSGSYGPQE